MILHLSPGSGSIELHIHDDAQVALYRPGDRPVLAQADTATNSRSAPRWFVLGLTGVVCLALGYGFAPRGSAAPTRVAGLVPQVQMRPTTPLPSNLPLMPGPAQLPEAEAAIAILPMRPRAEATPTDGVPAALARQLAQAPVMVPPATPARPPAGSSAFGLEN